MASKKKKASSPFLKLILVIGALAAVGVSAGIPLYLDSPKRTNANDPNRVKTATPVPTVIGSTNTPTVCPTANPNISCISQTSWCAPAAGTYPVYNGTGVLQPGTGMGGGDAAGQGSLAWTGPNSGPNADSVHPCSISQTTATPLPPSGHPYFKIWLGWLDGYYSEVNYITNAWSCSWANPTPIYEIDLSQANVIEFWIRGKDGTEEVAFQIMTGGGTCTVDWGQVPSDKLPLANYLEGGTLSTSWQRVRIPICDIAWTAAAGGSPPKTPDWARVVIFGFLGVTQAGQLEIYVADLVGKKF